MKIIVKVLLGQEHSIEVTEDTRVIEIKSKLEKLLEIPASQQKLILTGRPLADDKKVCDYNLKDGTKINLIVKQQATIEKLKENLQKSCKRDPVILQKAAHQFLRDFYSENDTNKIVDAFAKEFLRSVSTLSLDDYERIATSCLEEERSS